MQTTEFSGLRLGVGRHVGEGTGKPRTPRAGMLSPGTAHSGRTSEARRLCSLLLSNQTAKETTWQTQIEQLGAGGGPPRRLIPDAGSLGTRCAPSCRACWQSHVCGEGTAGWLDRMRGHFCTGVTLSVPCFHLVGF